MKKALGWFFVTVVSLVAGCRSPDAGAAAKMVASEVNIVDKAGNVRMVLGCTEPSGGAAIAILSQNGHPVIVLGTFPDSEQGGKEQVAIHMESGEEDIGATLSPPCQHL